MPKTNQNITKPHPPLKVVTIGGGTGTFPVVQALVELGVEITCIVAVSDSGGSSGRIRDEFGFQPVGDLRQSLAALARTPSQDWVQKLLLYRFSKGKGLKGHNLGNLILTALQDMTESTEKSLEIAERMFDLAGKVIPVTDSLVSLKIHYQDKTTLIGQHILNEPTAPAKPIDHVSLKPKAKASGLALSAIKSADWIIICPGDLYGSIMAVLAADGINQALNSTKAKIVFMVNLMSRKSQTANFTASDHLSVITKAIEKEVDVVVINSESIPTNVINIYRQDGEEQVVDDLVSDKHVFRTPLLSKNLHNQNSVDQVTRSLLRHDARKIARFFSQLFANIES